MVAGKPVGVVVDALATALCSLRAWLAARGDLAAELGFLDFGNRCRQVDQNPVEKIDAREGGRDCSALLIDVVPFAGDVRIMADDDKGFRGRGSFAPRQMRIQVFAEADVVGRVGDAKGKLTRNFLSV